jgi:hypothetical protein
VPDDGFDVDADVPVHHLEVWEEYFQAPWRGAAVLGAACPERVFLALEKGSHRRPDFAVSIKSEMNVPGQPGARNRGG